MSDGLETPEFQLFKVITTTVMRKYFSCNLVWQNIVVKGLKKVL